MGIFVCEERAQLFSRLVCCVCCTPQAASKRSTLHRLAARAESAVAMPHTTARVHADAGVAPHISVCQVWMPGMSPSARMQADVQMHAPVLGCCCVCTLGRSRRRRKM